MKVKFVAFSDIQIEDWKRFSKDHSRLFDNGIVLRKVLGLCKKYNCPALFCGDLFDDPKSIKNFTLQKTLEWLNEFKRERVKIYGIDGNHDQSERNSSSHRSPNYFGTLSTVFPNLIDTSNTTVVVNGTYISGIPYLSGNKDLMQQVYAIPVSKGSDHILLLHADLPGAKEPNYFELTPDNIPMEFYKAFKKFKLVLCGHIHRPQKLYSNVYVLGATHHQRSSDEGCDMGVWLIYENFTMKFIPLDLPKFITIEEGKEIPDNKNFYIQIPKKVINTSTNIALKATDTSTKIVDGYFKTLGIKSRIKRDLLIKYLHNARE